MRRLLVLLLVPVLLLSACGGGGDDDSSGDSGGSLSSVKVTGAAGKKPKVTGVKGVEVSKVESRVVTEGDGPKLSDGQTVNLNYELFAAKNGKAVTSTYKSGSPVPLQLDESKDTLLSKSIVGHTIGSRMLIAGPASKFYGSRAAQAGVDPDDTMVLVAELVSKFKPPKTTGTIDDVTVTGTYAKKPKVESKKNLVVAKTQSKVLKEGNGATVKKGDSVKVRYVGVDGRTGKEFDSSYKRGKPAVFTLDPAQVIPGFVKGLADQTIGSRVLVTIPYTDGYGPTGNPQAGIKGGDSLIFVVDLVKKQKG